MRFYPNFIKKKFHSIKRKKILEKIIKESFDKRLKQIDCKINFEFLIKEKIIKKINRKIYKNIFEIIKVVLNEFSEDKNKRN